MINLKGRRILIFQQRGWALNIGHFLAKKFQAEGAALAAFTSKKTTHDFIAGQKEVRYDLIVSKDEIIENPKKFITGEKITFKNICEFLEIDSVWPLIAGTRQQVKSYPDKYNYAFRQNLTDDELKEYTISIYKSLKNIFDEFKPELIVSPNFASLPHLFFYYLGRKYGCQMAAIADTKIKGYYILTNGKNYEQGSFYDQLEKLNAGQVESANRQKAKDYIKSFRQNFIQQDSYARVAKPKSLWQKIRHAGSPYYHILLWYLSSEPRKNRLKTIGPTIDYKPPRIILRDHYAHEKNKRFMEKFNYYPLEKIGQFIYYPLQFQPEEAIDTQARYFSNQLETARLIAMSLPDDYTLAVKEHPAMLGLRSASYLEKLARTPNVKLIDFRIPSEEVIKRADLIIGTGSTTMAEAAFYHKPSIALGDYGLTPKLPNVFSLSDLTAAAKIIKEALGADLRTQEYERKLENFVSAAFDRGIDINYSALWERGEEKDKMESFWNWYKTEIENLIT